MRYIPSNAENYGKKRSEDQIRYIVVHYTANRGDTAKNNAEYFKNNIVKASAHYFVDEKETVQSVKDEYAAYSVGGKKIKNTGGGKFYGKCTNANSISVELCDSVEEIPERTKKRAYSLIKELKKKYNVEEENIIRHYDVTGKICPKTLVDERKWQEFKQGIEGENMEELNALKKRVEELEKERTVYDRIDENMPKWIQEISVWGLSENILSGTGDGLGMTKQKAECLVMIKKALGK